MSQSSPLNTQSPTSFTQYPYPRRVLWRRFLRQLARLAIFTTSDFRIEGAEHLPKEGPLLVVANHFHFADPVIVMRTLPWPMEFLGGFHMPNAPQFVTWIPKLWGFYPVHRGAVSRTAMHATKAVLAQNGVMGIFPEAGSWAKVLRPPRPGTAFLAVETRARILPVGLDGVHRLFQERRPQIRVRIGKPFGPFETKERGRKRRAQLDEIGHEIMRQIAQLIPPEEHGVYSTNPSLRQAAQAVAEYPYHDLYEQGI